MQYTLTNCSKLYADEGYHSQFYLLVHFIFGLWFHNLFQGFYNIIHKLFEIFCLRMVLDFLLSSHKQFRTFFYYYISGSKFNNLFDMHCLFLFALLPDFALDYEGFISK